MSKAVRRLEPTTFPQAMPGDPQRRFDTGHQFPERDVPKANAGQTDQSSDIPARSPTRTAATHQQFRPHDKNNKACEQQKQRDSAERSPPFETQRLRRGFSMPFRSGATVARSAEPSHCACQANFNLSALKLDETLGILLVIGHRRHLQKCHHFFTIQLSSDFCVRRRSPIL